MKKSNNDQITEKVFNILNESRIVKVATIATITLLGFYLLGHVFKIGSHTIRAYLDFKSALKGQ